MNKNKYDKENDEEDEESNAKSIENLLIMYQFLNKHRTYIRNNLFFDANTDYCNNYTILRKINNLNSSIENKLRKRCKHDIEIDHIDTSLDDTKQIRYCSKCLLTF